MPLRRGRSAKGKASTKTPSSKPITTAAGWDSDDDLLADDPKHSALSAFPSISSDQEGPVDEDALLGPHDVEDTALVHSDSEVLLAKPYSCDGEEEEEEMASSENGDGDLDRIANVDDAVDADEEISRVSSKAIASVEGEEEEEEERGDLDRIANVDDAVDADEEISRVSSNSVEGGKEEEEEERGAFELSSSLGVEENDADIEQIEDLVELDSVMDTVDDDLVDENDDPEVAKLVVGESETEILEDAKLESVEDEEEEERVDAKAEDEGVEETGGDDELDYDFEDDDIGDSPNITFEEDKVEDLEEQVEPERETASSKDDQDQSDKKLLVDEKTDGKIDDNTDGATTATTDGTQSSIEKSKVIDEVVEETSDASKERNAKNDATAADVCDGVVERQSSPSERISTSPKKEDGAKNGRDVRDERRSISDDDDDDDDDDRDCRRRRRRNDFGDRPRSIETRVSRGSRGDGRRRDGDRWRSSPSRPSPHRRSPPRHIQNRIHPLDQFLSMTSGSANKIHINPRFMPGNPCPPLMTPGVAHSSPSRPTNPSKNMGLMYPPPPGTFPLTLNHPITLPFAPPMGGPNMPMRLPMNNPPPPFFMQRPPSVTPPFFNAGPSSHPNPLFRLPYIPGGFPPPTPHPAPPPHLMRGMETRRRSPSPRRRNRRSRSRSRSPSPRRTRSNSPGRKRVPSPPRRKSPTPPPLTPEELEYQRKLDEQKKLRLEILKKKEENRQKAAKEKEAELSAKAAARNSSNAPRDPDRVKQTSGQSPPSSVDDEERTPPTDPRLRRPQLQIPPRPQQHILPRPPQQIPPRHLHSHQNHPATQPPHHLPPHEEQQHPSQRNIPLHQDSSVSRLDGTKEQQLPAKTSRPGNPPSQSLHAHAQTPIEVQRRKIVEDLRKITTSEVGNTEGSRSNLAPSPQLTHSVLNAPAMPMTSKKVTIIKKVAHPAAQERQSDHSLGADFPEANYDEVTADSQVTKPSLPSPLRPTATSTGPKPSLPDLPLPSFDAAKSPTKKDAKKRLKIVNIDKETGIITTADGWKLRAKTFNMKTADGGERVVKKYVKVEEHELRAADQSGICINQIRDLHQPMNAAEAVQNKRPLISPTNDLSPSENPSGPSNVKIQRILPPSSSSSISAPGAKQPLSARFNRLQRVTPPDLAVPAPADLKTCFVILSNLSSTITDLKIKELCNRVGPIFSIQYRKSEGRALVKFKKSDDAREFAGQYNSRLFENQRIKVHLRNPEIQS